MVSIYLHIKTRINKVGSSCCVRKKLSQKSDMHKKISTIFFFFFFYENGFKLPVWLIVESLEEHCVEWQELEEILE